MPSFQSSRRAPGMKDSDYDHEINLVDHDGRAASLSIESLNDGPRASTGSRLLRDEENEREHDRLAESSANDETTSAQKLGDQKQGKTSQAEDRPEVRALEPQVVAATEAPSIEVQEPTPREIPIPTRNGSRRRERLATTDRESAIDVLWENERGCICCGVALFSGKALGNLDPSPWTNQFHKTSPTTIRTAQVPDPTWEWAWPEWRVHKEEGVEMDEHGWEYSFMFSKKFSWHGPKWWNSFVRRRAWVRRRVKKKPEDVPDDPHMLNSGYFTVTPANRSRASSVVGSRRESISKASIQTSMADEKPDIEDIDTLMTVLRASRIDREKIEAVENYLTHAKDNLEHLQDEMHDIMGIFVFQASRRLLLSRLTQIYDEASGSEGRRNKPDTMEGRRKHLAAAIKHADEEVKKLSYWSDVKGLAENGEAHHAVEENEGWNESWQGVDQSGPAHVNSGVLPGSPKM